jgi:hypothetical protein
VTLLHVLAAGFLLSVPWQTGSRTHLLIVSGVGGEPAYEDRFYQLGAAMVDAAKTRFGLPDSNVVFLAEKPERDAKRIRGQSTKVNVTRTLTEMGARTKAGDQVIVLLIGHGAGTDESPRFNIPGPDISAQDFATALAGFTSQRVAFINAASASGDFLPLLSAQNRVIITATKSGFERNETMFGTFFVDAFSKDVADADKDGRVSLLEAFTYARREVARAYEGTNRLLTEHAQLDDDGDKKGTAEPDTRTPDGGLARGIALGASTANAAVASNDPRVQALVREREILENRVDSLRRRKASMDSVTYERNLENLLLELARKTQEIRAADSTRKRP